MPKTGSKWWGSQGSGTKLMSKLDSTVPGIYFIIVVAGMVIKFLGAILESLSTGQWSVEAYSRGQVAECNGCRLLLCPHPCLRIRVSWQSSQR